MPISNTLVILLITLILLPISIVLYLNNSKRMVQHDPRRGLTPNATNYNIDGTLSEEMIANASKKDIQEIINKANIGELPSLSRKDFYLLLKKLESLEKE